MSAYVMLNESYKQYRSPAKTVYGEDADDKIHAEMAKDAMVSSPTTVIRFTTWTWILKVNGCFSMILPQRSILEPQWQRC